MIEQTIFYSSPSWLLGDHLGSTSMVTDASGVMVSEVRYSAFGETRYQNGTLTTDYLYTGQRQEAEIGLYYYVARWYDPAIGRFIQADSIVPNPGSALGFDRYAYVNNNPLAYVDPTGHMVDAAGSYNPWHHTVRDEEGNDIPLLDGEEDCPACYGLYNFEFKEFGWYEIPCELLNGQTMVEREHVIFYDGSWEPRVGYAIDIMGILVDGVGVIGSIFSFGELIPGSTIASETYGFIENGWYSYNLSQGNYDDVYAGMEQEMLDAQAGVPFLGLAMSIEGAIENRKVIKSGYKEVVTVFIAVSNSDDLPYDYPLLGPHPWYFGNENSSWYSGEIQKND